MALTEQAQRNDDNVNIQLILVDKIFSDDNFNHRGKIAPVMVMELAQDIRKNGLLLPILIRPVKDSDPDGYDYAIIAGHRRHKAYVINQTDYIPARIYEGLNDFQCRTLSAVENLKREDLNLMQEAKIIEHYRYANWTIAEISEEIGKSSNWVQIRFAMLDLEPEIQEEIAAGFLNQKQIWQVSRCITKEQRFEATKKAKIAKMRGEKIANVGPVRTQKYNSRKHRSRDEIEEMLTHLNEFIEPCFGTRMAAWCAGNISNIELHRDIKDLCDGKGIFYEMPAFS